MYNPEYVKLLEDYLKSDNIEEFKSVSPEIFGEIKKLKENLDIFNEVETKVFDKYQNIEGLILNFNLFEGLSEKAFEKYKKLDPATKLKFSQDVVNIDEYITQKDERFNDLYHQIIEYEKRFCLHETSSCDEHRNGHEEEEREYKYTFRFVYDEIIKDTKDRLDQIIRKIELVQKIVKIKNEDKMPQETLDKNQVSLISDPLNR